MRWLPRSKVLDEIRNVDAAVGSSDKTYHSDGTTLTVEWAEPIAVDLAQLETAIATSGNHMSVTGAGLLGGHFRDSLAAVKAKIAKATEAMNGAMNELHDTADHATNLVKQVKDETADLQAALGLHSNNPPA